MCISALPNNYFQAFSVAKLSTFFQTLKPVFMFPQKKSTWMPTSALHNQKLNTWNCNRLNKCGLDYSGQHFCQSSNSSSVSHRTALKNRLFLMGIHRKRGPKFGLQDKGISINIWMHIAFVNEQRTWTTAFAYKFYNTIGNKYTLRPQGGRDTALTIYIKSRYQLRAALIKRCTLKIQWL